MNTRIAELESPEDETPKPVGFVFADMNGLKYINDHQGHQAGDLLLKNAANILQNIFIGCEIYRAGGDEFFILVPGAEEADLLGKIAEVKKRSGSFENVNFAAGCCVLRPGMDLHEALSEADARMYEAKKAKRAQREKVPVTAGAGRRKRACAYSPPAGRPPASCPR